MSKTQLNLGDPEKMEETRREMMDALYGKEEELPCCGDCKFCQFITIHKREVIKYSEEKSFVKSSRTENEEIAICTNIEGDHYMCEVDWKEELCKDGGM